MFKEYIEKLELLEKKLESCNKEELYLLLINNTKPLYYIESVNYDIPIEKSINKALYEGCKTMVLSEIKTHKEKLWRLEMFINYSKNANIITEKEDYILKGNER